MFDIKNIKNPDFIKELNNKQKDILASEIREFLIENISKTGGHLASNLGIVELTIALYSVFDYKKDNFLFDVGHQSYVHKILTGRAAEFSKLRQLNGLSGYISREESIYDIWESGHSSTSISAMAGLMLAYGKNSNKRVISIIGDASIVNGISLEALNHLGTLKGYKPIVILNDNKMGISKSVGALSRVFDNLRSNKFMIKLKRVLNKILPVFLTNFFHKIKRSIKGLIKRDNIFEEFGFDYYGPVDGHDIKALTRILTRIERIDEPVLLHVITKKGKGYKFAEEDYNGDFHGVEPFDVETGKLLKEKDLNEHSYSEIVSETLCQLREKENFYVITPAMKVGAKLEKFANLYNDSFIDVGIAEEHASVMAAGLAIGGKKVILLMYSTFSQRAFDYILNDICRSNLNVIIGIDRAGIVGQDGQTHAGIYDVGMFSLMPNIKILMPKDAKETMGLFNQALNSVGPVVIRYPRASENIDFNNFVITKTEFNWEYLLKGNKGIVISYGPLLNMISEIITDNNLDVSLVNARIIKPLDIKFVEEIRKLNLPILVIEEVVKSGSLAQALNEYVANIKSICFAVDDILKFGKVSQIKELYGFGYHNILKEIRGLYEA